REEKQKTEKERKNTKKRKIPTSVHFLLQSKNPEIGKTQKRKSPEVQVFTLLQPKLQNRKEEIIKLKPSLIPSSCQNLQKQRAFTIAHRTASEPSHTYLTRSKARAMAEQTNEFIQGQVDGIKGDIAGMREQIADLVMMFKGKFQEEPKGTPHQASSSVQFHGTGPTNKRFTHTIHPNGEENEEGEEPQVNEDPHVGSGVNDQSKMASDLDLKAKWAHLEERLKVVEGTDSYSAVSASQLCLVPELVLPYKFKMPDFEKYGGTTCPKGHLAMYCNKMAGYVHDEKLMIHCFQNSLSGTALRWYMNLESTRIRKWQDLAEAFMKHYKHNQDLAPDREDLRNMEKKENESFREYAHRWRDRATEVHPPLSEREMISIFFETLRAPFYNNMLGSIASNFSDLLIIGERIEKGIKHGKIESHESRRTTATKKKDEVHATFQENNGKKWSPLPKSNYTTSYVAATMPTVQTPTVKAQSPSVQPTKTQDVTSKNEERGRPTSFRPRSEIDPIPISYTELYPRLLKNKQVAPAPYQQPSPPFPKWYNPEARCEYHGGAVGHLIENCPAFKYRVQDLIRAGWLKFEEHPDHPNVNKNPLPNHSGNSSNAIFLQEGHHIKRKVDEVNMPFEYVCKILQNTGYIQSEEGDYDLGNSEETFRYHNGRRGHSLKDCKNFRSKLQDLMDSKLVSFCSSNTGEVDIHMTSHEENQPNPLGHIIRYTAAPRAPVVPKVTVISVRSPQQVTGGDKKALPWNYSGKIVDTNDVESVPVSNITGIGGMTRTGRVYGLPRIQEEGESSKRMEYQKDPKKTQIQNDESIARGPVEQQEEPNPRPLVSDKDAYEFLKLVRQSEFKVIEQLNRMPARISLLDLMMASEPHRLALLKVLNQAHFCQNISVERMGGVVNAVLTVGRITFNDDELPPEGKEHTKALHISVRCKEFVVARALIDNGSALNVIPKSTLNRLPIEDAFIRPSLTIVRAFDGTKRQVMGEVELPIQIGPKTFDIMFHVMDIHPTYSLLLGRPWLHAAGVVPSSL
ncbi:hypothetical protein LINPERHAP2_LOCUS7036, partial [Linum perenne]